MNRIVPVLALVFCCFQVSEAQDDIVTKKKRTIYEEVELENVMRR